MSTKMEPEGLPEGGYSRGLESNHKKVLSPGKVSLLKITFEAGELHFIFHVGLHGRCSLDPGSGLSRCLWAKASTVN